MIPAHRSSSVVRKRGTDNVSHQIFYYRLIFRPDTVFAEHVKPGMPPRREHPDHLLCDLSFGEVKPEYLVPGDGPQYFHFHSPINMKGAQKKGCSVLV